MLLRPVTLLGLVAVASLAVTGFSGATLTAKKQRVVINQLESVGKGKWSLLPLTSGPVSSDKGTYTWRTTVDKRGVKDGQSFRHVVATVTFEGANGSFVVREDDTLVSASASHTAVTGTWKLLRGTEAYEGVVGGGRLGAALGFGKPDPWRYEGFMTSP